jgi:hypothetical protein
MKGYMQTEVQILVVLSAIFGSLARSAAPRALSALTVLFRIDGRNLMVDDVIVVLQLLLLVTFGFLAYKKYRDVQNKIV